MPVVSLNVILETGTVKPPPKTIGTMSMTIMTIATMARMSFFLDRDLADEGVPAVVNVRNVRFEKYALKL